MEKTVEATITQAQNLAEEEEDEIDFLEVWSALRNGWKAILLATLIGAMLMGAFHYFFVTPSYQADAMIYSTNTDSVVTFSDLQLSAALTEDYANIIKSRSVLKRVIDELELDVDFKQLGELVKVENPDSTHIIHIFVTCDDWEMARNIANAIMNVSVAQIYQVVGSSEPTVIDHAEAEAVENVTPSIFKYMLIGALIGAFLLCVVLVIRVVTHTSLKTEEDVNKYLHIPVLAAVPYYREGAKTKGK